MISKKRYYKRRKQYKQGYLNSQLSVSSYYGGYLYEPWRKRRLTKKRVQPLKIKPITYNYSVDSLIYYHFYFPSLLRIERKVKKIKFNKFKFKNYVTRERYLYMFSYLHDKKLKRYKKKKAVIINNNHRIYNHQTIYHQKLKLNDDNIDTFSYKFVHGGLLVRPPTVIIQTYANWSTIL